VIGSTRSVRVFAYGSPADMRKGFDGLFGLVREHLQADPLSGDLFLFVSSNRKRAKVLMWDGTGLCLYAKRLEKGRFAHLWGEAPIELTIA
jgi:transposase